MTSQRSGEWGFGSAGNLGGPLAHAPNQHEFVINERLQAQLWGARQTFDQPQRTEAVAYLSKHLVGIGHGEFQADSGIEVAKSGQPRGKHMGRDRCAGSDLQVTCRFVTLRDRRLRLG